MKVIKMKTNVLLDSLQKDKKELTISEALKEAREKTFRELLEDLNSKNQLDWFLDTKIGDVITLSQLKKVVEEEVEDEEDFKGKILNHLKTIDMKEFKRGVSSSEIKEVIGGNSQTLRKLLDALKADGKVWSTGKTQGMKWVLAKYKDKAEAEYLKKS